MFDETGYVKWKDLFSSIVSLLEIVDRHVWQYVACIIVGKTKVSSLIFCAMFICICAWAQIQNMEAIFCSAVVVLVCINSQSSLVQAQVDLRILQSIATFRFRLH